MGLIGISGHVGSGKDLIGKIIQHLLEPGVTGNDYKDCTDDEILAILNDEPLSTNTWKIKKFADKLKDCVCLIAGCSRADLENASFKNKEIDGFSGVWLVYTDKYQDTPYSPEWFESEEAAEKFVSEQNCVYFHEITPATLTYRQLLQRLGTNACRVVHPDIWVNGLMSDYASTQFNFYPGYYGHKCSICDSTFMADKHQTVCEPCCSKVIFPNWIITDMRFPNELKAVKDREGITIRINRPCTTCGTYERMYCSNPYHLRNKHESETALDAAEFDYTIENNGTVKDLVEKVREILIKEKLL